jgi:hypothetical protein
VRLIDHLPVWHLHGSSQRLGRGVEAPLQEPTLIPTPTVASNVAKISHSCLDHTICQPAKLLINSCTCG